MVESGAHVNHPNIDNVFPLHVAVSMGDIDFISFLVKERAAKPQCRDIHSTTPLHIAAQSGNLEVVNFLISNGALVNTPDEGKLLYSVHVLILYSWPDSSA
jgi:ankyrin repeat protein